MKTEDIRLWKKLAIIIGHIAAIIWFWLVTTTGFNYLRSINPLSPFFGTILASAFTFISILIIYKFIKRINLSKRTCYYNIVIVVFTSAVIFASYTYKGYNDAVPGLIFTMVSIIPTIFTKKILNSSEQAESNNHRHSLEKWELYALGVGHCGVLLFVLTRISVLSVFVWGNALQFLIYILFSIITLIITYKLFRHKKLSKKLSLANVILLLIISIITFIRVGEFWGGLFWSSMLGILPSIPSAMNIIIIKKYGEDPVIEIKEKEEIREEKSTENEINKQDLIKQNIIDIKTAFGYKGATIIYKVKIENNTAKPISDLQVYPYVPNVFLLKEKEKSISLIEPRSSQTVTFEIRPTGECGDCNVSGRVNYYDTVLMERKDIQLEPKSLSIICPMLHRKEIGEDAWRDLVSGLVKAEETTTDVPVDGEGLFGIISEILKDLNLFMLPPGINKAPQIFRGTARFYGEGVKGLRYAAQIEVVGGARKSKLILKAWAEREDALTGFYHGVLDEIEKRVKVKEYINDSIVQYNVHIGDKIGTLVKDSVVQRSNIGASARKCPNCGREVEANEKFCLECGAKL